MLRIATIHPMASCSKAPRGLFVLLRVGRIFTATAISPSPWLRQCPDRDAFRAGRNLPDKEFRYLRTVIVTAAVYRGFGSEREPLPLTFRHWAGITPYTSPCGFSRELWFWYPVARAAPLRPPRAPPARGFTLPRHSFFRRYGVNLPSSLTRGHSSALVCSTCLPVSVCGTGTYGLPSRHFLTAQVPRHRPAREGWSAHRLSDQRRRGFAAPVSLPACTALVSPRRLPLSIRPWSNDRHVVREYAPVVHHLRLAAMA